jgi:hypothetical protein
MFLSFSFYGQKNIDTKKSEIDSIVNYIEKSKITLKESIVEGEIIAKKLFVKNGGWEVYVLNNNFNIPIRITYSENFNNVYRKLVYYYNNEKIIFVNFQIEFKKQKLRKNSKNIKFYFENELLLFASEYDENYNSSSILLEEINMKNLID